MRQIEQALRSIPVVREVVFSGLSKKAGQTPQMPHLEFKLTKPISWAELNRVSLKHGFRPGKAEFGKHGEIILTEKTQLPSFPRVQIIFNYQPGRAIRKATVRIHSLNMREEFEGRTRGKILNLFEELAGGAVPLRKVA